MVLTYTAWGNPKFVLRLGGGEMTFNAAVVLFAAALVAAPANADLVGETIQISRQIPSLPFLFGPFPYTVGVSNPIALSTGNNLYASASGTDLFLIFGPAAGSGGPYAPLDHFILFDDLFAGTSTIITGVTFKTDLAGFTSSDLVFADHSVKVGEGGIFFQGGQTMDINLQTSIVPEPSELVTIGAGLTLLGIFLSCRRYAEARRKRFRGC